MHQKETGEETEREGGGGGIKIWVNMGKSGG